MYQRPRFHGNQTLRRIQINMNPSRSTTFVYSFLTYGLWLFDHHTNNHSTAYEYIKRFVLSSIYMFFFGWACATYALCQIQPIQVESCVALRLALHMVYFLALNGPGRSRSYRPFWCTCWYIIDGNWCITNDIDFIYFAIELKYKSGYSVPLSVSVSHAWLEGVW